MFFFSSRRRHTRCSRDWSSDVCSSDLRTYLTEQERRAGRSASEKQSRERRIAKGLCEKCTKPLAHHSVRECDLHLEIHRQRDARDRAKKGIKPGTQGRQPGTLAALAAGRA